MTSTSRTFRVFVSSTFADFAAERNALQEMTFPRLQEFCREKGASFQAIDLRWGVSNEASLDQQAMNICLGEIRRCQKITPRPNFLILLGQRYGARPPVAEIKSDLFEKLLEALDSPKSMEFLNKWYVRDDNSVPAKHVLLSRQADGPYAKYDDWQPVERALQQTLLQGATALGLSGNELLPFSASATHQEIVKGALEVKRPEEKVLCVFREIEGFPIDKDGHPTHGAEEFVDADPSHINDLKDQLKRVIPLQNIINPPSKTTWSSETNSPGSSHLEQLAEEVYQRLRNQIESELGSYEQHNIRSKATDLLDFEGLAHRDVAERHLRTFVGREEVISRMSAHLRNPDGRIFVISAKGGTGKSALLSKAEKLAREVYSDSCTVCRFIGATPAASECNSLLRSLCLEICRRLGRSESDVPKDDSMLSDFFRRLLEDANESLTVILDALDQIPPADTGRSLDWLPHRLSPHVKIFVSIRPGEFDEVLRNRKTVIEDLKGLSTVEGESLLDLWLQNAGRTLTIAQRKVLIRKFKRSNRLPLYLKLAFEEARRWKSWEKPKKLGIGIEKLLRIGLFRRLSQYHGKTLVAHMLGCLAASRHGLSEGELLSLLSEDVGVYSNFVERSHHLPPDFVACARSYLREQERQSPDDEDLLGWIEKLRKDKNKSDLLQVLTSVCAPGGPHLPFVLFARLRADLDPYLTTRTSEGLILLDFYHQELRDASAREFLLGGKKARHGALASHFHRAADPLSDGSWKGTNRYLKELPYHLTESERWDDIIGTETSPAPLNDLWFIQAKCQAGLLHDLIKNYNAVIEALPELRDRNQRIAARDKAMQEYHDALVLFATVWQDYKRKVASMSKLKRRLFAMAGILIGRFRKPSHPAMPTELSVDPSALEPEVFSPRAERLQRFANFVSGHIAILSKYPQDILSLAFNLAEDGAVAEAATQQIERFAQPWLKRSFRPPKPPIRPQCIRFFDYLGFNVKSIGLTRDGSRALLRCNDDKLRLLDMASGEFLRTVELLGDSVRDVGLTEDGQSALAGGSKELKLWDLESGQCLRKFEGHYGNIGSLLISPDGKKAISSGDGALRIWDLDTGDCVKKIQGCGGKLTLCPDGRRFISVGDEGFEMWNLDTGRSIRVFGAVDERFDSVCVSPDGLRAVSVGGFRSKYSLQLWDLESGRCLHSFGGHEERVRSVEMTPDGRHIITGETRPHSVLRLWDVKSGKFLRIFDGHTGTGSFAVIGPDSRHAISAANDKTLRQWDLHAEQRPSPRINERHSGAVKCVVVSPNGGFVISGGEDDKLGFWNLKSGKCLGFLEGHSRSVYGLSISPDERLVLSASLDETVRLWSLDTGRCLRILEHNTSGFGLNWTVCVCMAPDGRHGFSGDKAGNIRYWDLISGKCLQLLIGHTDLVMSLCLSPDGQKLFSASDDCTVRVWELHSWECVRIYEEHTDWLCSVSVSPDGCWAVSGGRDMILRLWETETGKTLRTFEGHTHSIRCVSVSPDGCQILSSSRDKTLRLWDAKSGQCTAIYHAKSEVPSCAFSPSGDRIVCCAEDGLVHFLDLMNKPHSDS